MLGMDGMENKQTRKSYTVRGFVALLASLFLCVGCDDELPRSAQSAVEAGQFVVDYTAEAGIATRTIQENMAKGVRINSLTYLLYNSEGYLEKRREIPGLETDGETWPLTRANMTWEQREALKDTLYQEESYHVVFVANIDSVICGWKDEAGAPWSPLRETEAYKTVHLQMPYQPFNDRNMFYVFTKDIVSGNHEANRDNPYNCPVVLRRAVTRTDILIEQLPVWEDGTTGGGTETPDGGIDPGEGSTPDEGTTTPDEGGSTPDEGASAPSEGTGAEEGIEGEGARANPEAYPASCTLPDAIKAYFLLDFNTIVLNTHQEKFNQTVVDATGVLIDRLKDHFSGWKYKTYRTRLDEINALIQGDGKSDFIDKINQVEGREGDNILSNFQTHLIHTMLNDLADNDAIRKLFEQSANRKQGQFATIDYEGKSGMSKYYLSGKAPDFSLEKSLRIEADLATTREDIPYLGFQWIGLSDPTKNHIAKVSWYQTADATTEAETFAPTAAIQTELGMNEKCAIYYRPASELDLKKEWGNVKTTQIVCNLRTALPFAETDSAMVADINAALEGGKIPGYTTKLEEMILTINYPDITNSEVLEIKDRWELIK